MAKFIIAGLGKGTYGSGNPLSGSNLFEIGETYQTPEFKPTKPISATSYTIIAEDKNKWLLFTATTQVTVTIPLDLMNESEELEGATLNSSVSFVGATNVNLYYPSEFTSTITTKGVFGIKAYQANHMHLFGTLIPV